MKKHLAYILMLIALLSAGISYADEVNIGSGTSTEYVPFNTSSHSSLYQCLYYPSEHRLIPASVSHKNPDIECISLVSH